MGKKLQMRTSEAAVEAEAFECLFQVYDNVLEFRVLERREGGSGKQPPVWLWVGAGYILLGLKLIPYMILNGLF